MDFGARGLLRPAVIAGSLLAANLALVAGLVVSALRPRPVVVIPSARAGETLLPGAVPEAAAREFALRYVLHFDNFTPSTIEASHGVLKPMIAARSWAQATEALEKRRVLVHEGRMSSQVLPLETKVEGLVVTVRAIRRIFISDRLNRESEVNYVVSLERQPPVEPNPFGLAVVSQEIRPVINRRGNRGNREGQDE